MSNLFLILLSVALGAIGQVILKIGANQLKLLPATGDSSLWLELLKIAKVPSIWIGLVFFGSSFLLWIKVLTKAELSYAYPMVSLGYVIVVILSFFLFHEALTVSKIIGIVIIIVGVIILNRGWEEWMKKRREREHEVDATTRAVDHRVRLALLVCSAFVSHHQLAL